MREDHLRGPGTQHVDLIDPVRTGKHPVHKRHHLAPRPGRTRHVAK
jgi:hypothetical protein